MSVASKETQVAQAPLEEQEGTGKTFGRMLALGFVIAGVASVDGATNDVIPQTARYFTDYPLIISLIIALNRLFGFLVQPYVSWKSDHVMTRYGRRRPFLLFGLPSTMICLLIVGAYPMFFPGESRFLLPVLLSFIFFNVLLQACQDVNWGAHFSLYGDSFPQRQLGRAVSIRQYCGIGIGIFMTLVALPLVDKNPFYYYLFVAGFLILSFLLTAFVVRERPPAEPPKPEKFRPLKHLGMFKDRDLLKLAIVGTLILTVTASYSQFLVLFVTRTLELDNTTLASVRWWQILVRVAVTFPIGFCVDRYGPKAVLTCAFFTQTVISMIFYTWVHDYNSFLVVSLVEAAAIQALDLPLVAMTLQYAAPSQRGSVFALIQYPRGLFATFSTVLLGWVVGLSFSMDATLYLAEDVKRPKQMAQVLSNPQTEIDRLFVQNLSEESKKLIKAELSREDEKKLQKALVADMNKIIKGPSLYNETMFKDVDLKKPVEELIERRASLSKDEMLVLNRSLLQASYPEAISQKADYRVAFVLCGTLALCGGIATLTTRRGKYAQTIKDKKQASK